MMITIQRIARNWKSYFSEIYRLMRSAELAHNAGNEDQVRICARRAAGMEAWDFFQRALLVKHCQNETQNFSAIKPLQRW
jgi:hypothetical protein